jgi:hypothetical protein
MKATILLSFAWIAASAGCRRSASFRHLLWAVGIFGTLILPLVSLLLPAWHSSTLGNAARFLSPAHTVAATRSSQILPPMIVDARTDSQLFSKLPGMVLLLWTAGSFFSAPRAFQVPDRGSR